RLPAGTGLMYAAGLFVTPVWLDDVGLGLDGEIGAKISSAAATHGSVTLTRFPLVLGVHSFIAVSRVFRLYARAGVQHDLGVHVEGQDSLDQADRSYTSTWGPLAEIGAEYQVPSRELGASAALRYSTLKYEHDTEHYDVNCIGLFGAVHLMP